MPEKLIRHLGRPVDQLLKRILEFPKSSIPAHGRPVQEAHEKPPVVEQEEKADPGPLFPLEVFDEKTESNNSASRWPHKGQQAFSLSSLRRHKYSKRFPQFLHLNSWIGIALTFRL